MGEGGDTSRPSSDMTYLNVKSRSHGGTRSRGGGAFAHYF